MFDLKCPCCRSKVVPGENIPVGMENKPKNIVCPNCENELMLDKKTTFQRNAAGVLGLIGIPLIAHYFGINTVVAYFGMGLIILLVVLLVISHRRLKLVPVSECKQK